MGNIVLRPGQLIRWGILVRRINKFIEEEV
jgi:hypothetical protein